MKRILLFLMLFGLSIQVQTVDKNEFIEQFIKCDLFTPDINDLSKLEWRIKGQKLTKAKVLEYMKSPEGLQALNSFSKEKKKQLFKGFDDIEGITERNINDFIEQYFNVIFK